MTQSLLMPVTSGPPSPRSLKLLPLTCILSALHTPSVCLLQAHCLPALSRCFRSPAFSLPSTPLVCACRRPTVSPLSHAASAHLHPLCPPHAQRAPAAGLLHLLYLYPECLSPCAQVTQACAAVTPRLWVASSERPPPCLPLLPCSGPVAFTAGITAHAGLCVGLSSLLERKGLGAGATLL